MAFDGILEYDGNMTKVHISAQSGWLVNAGGVGH